MQSETKAYGLFLIKIVRFEPKLLLIQSNYRSSIPFHLSIAKGKYDFNLDDTVESCAKRHCKEKTGLTTDDYLMLNLSLDYTYKIRKNGEMIDKVIRGFFAIQVSDSPISLDNDYLNYEYASTNRLHQLVELGLQDFLLNVYLEAMHTFEEHFFNRMCYSLSQDHLLTLMNS